MEAYLVAVGVIALIYMLLAIGLNLQYGYTGLVNFGHVAFFAIGSYTSALLSLNGWSLAITFIVAMLLAALVAYPIGLLSLRLSDDYLAVVTLGFSETVRLVLQQEEWLTRGVQGLPGIPRLFQSLGVGQYADIATFATLIVCNAIAIGLITHLVRSPYGRLIQAVRDDEIAVETLGKDPARLKVQVFMLGAALAGLAGLMAGPIYAVQPGMGELILIQVFVVIVIGGIGSIRGALVGAIIVGVVDTLGRAFLKPFLATLISPTAAEAAGPALASMLIYLLIAVVLAVKPAGLFQSR